MTLREIITKIGFDVDEEKVKGAENLIEKFGLKSKLTMAAIAAAALAIGKASITAAADMEMLTTQFEVMLGSSEKAVAMMDDLKDFAASTPFALSDLSKGTQQLLSFGVASEDVVDTMRMLGDTAGGDAEKLSGLVLAYGKVTTKGKASLEEINMMAERGLPIFDILAQRMGASKEELFKLISAGKVGADDVTAAFRTMTSEGGMFFEGMKKQSETFSGLMSTLKDNLTMVAASIGDAMLPDLKEGLKEAITWIQTTLQDLADGIMAVLAPVLRMLLKVIIAIFKALNPVFKILSSILKIIGTIGGKILDRITSGINKWIFYIQKVLEAVKFVYDVFIWWLTIVFKIYKNIFMIYKFLVGKVLGAIKKVALAIWDLIFGGIKKGVNNVGEQIEKIKGWVFGAITWIAGIVKAFWDWLLKRFPGLAKVIQQIGNIFISMWNTVRDTFLSIWDAITSAIQAVIGWVNKIPGVDLKIPAFPGTKGAEGKESTGELLSFIEGESTPAFDSSSMGSTTKEANTTVNSKIEVNVPAGTDAQGVAVAVEDAVKSVFTLELKKILVNAGY